MSISKLSMYICNWMNKVNSKSSEENKVIQYGLELLLDTTLKFIFILMIGIFMKKGIETLIILVSFCGLRLQAGGKHAKTGLGCGLSMLMIWATSLILSIYLKIELMPLLIIYIVCSVIVVYCTPRTINISYFNILEIRTKKRNAFIFLTVLMLIAVLSTNIREIIAYPVILEVLTLLPKNK